MRGKLLTLTLVAMMAAPIMTGCGNHGKEYLGHEYVDLGLPSGTKWATANIGGGQDDTANDYYSWGESETKEHYYIDTYRWADGYKAGKTAIDEDDDVAHVKWGGKWRLPTKEDFAELEDTLHNTTWIPSPYKGHVSWIVRSKRNNRSIRLTALGYRNRDKLEQDSIGFYLGATIGDTDGMNKANTFTCMGFSKDTIKIGDAGGYFGYSVRPVFR